MHHHQECGVGQLHLVELHGVVGRLVGWLVATVVHCRCLSATQPPDQCIHLYTNVRRNGSNLRITSCSEVENKLCDSVDLEDPTGDFIFDCKSDFTCHHLEGLFQCTNPYQPGVPMYQQKVQENISISFLDLTSILHEGGWLLQEPNQHVRVRDGGVGGESQLPGQGRLSGDTGGPDQ